MTEITENNNTATDDFIATIQSGFDSVTEKEEAAPAEEVANEEPEEESQEEPAFDDIEEEDDEDTQAKPEKPLPKGKRAREEYEARVRERDARIEAEKRIARLEVENENFKRSLEIINKPTEDSTPKSDDDYLREKNIDPDAFIDDAAKAALVVTMKENDALKEAVKGTQSTAANAAYDNTMISAFNAFTPDVKADVGGAINHLIETEARALLVDYPNATIEDARKAAKESLNATMKQKYNAGVNPLDWAYRVAQSRNYTPQLTSKQQAGKIDVKKVAESQNRAGSPNVTKVAVSSKDSTSLSAVAGYDDTITNLFSNRPQVR
jgi:hypothetical protein